MMTMTSMHIIQCSQFYESKIPFHGDSSQFGCGLASCDLITAKQRLNSVNTAYVQYLQRRGGQKCEFGYRKVNILRPIKSNSGGAPRSSLNDDTASTSKSTESIEPKQGSKSVDSSEAAGTGLSALDAYFSKLQGGKDNSQALVNAVASAMLPLAAQHRVVNAETENGAAASRDDVTELHGLKALDAYFDKLRPKTPEPEPIQQVVVTAPEKESEPTEEELLMKSLMEVKEEYDKHENSRSFVKNKHDSPTHDLQFQVTSRNEMDLSSWDLQEQHTPNSNLINILVATNIAVYLFGLASPHNALGITDSSVPFVYGAKVNDLIMEGQWWRFITPMFLHASLLHVGLGSWALLSFGPAVESAYGPLGFAMIYFLGGLFGDLTSFFHTPEWTVGGTGPIYALVGTWVVYLLKNREIIGKDIADDMIRKVVILSALNVALCNSLPIDDWTHLGATLIGTLFGYLASPTMQLNVAVKEASPEKEAEDAASYFWFTDGASPVRLSLIFALCLGIFFIFYQISISGFNDLYLLPGNDIFS